MSLLCISVQMSETFGLSRRPSLAFTGRNGPSRPGRRSILVDGEGHKVLFVLVQRLGRKLDGLSGFSMLQFESQRLPGVEGLHGGRDLGRVGVVAAAVQGGVAAGVDLGQNQASVSHFF